MLNKVTNNLAAPIQKQAVKNSTKSGSDFQFALNKGSVSFVLIAFYGIPNSNLLIKSPTTGEFKQKESKFHEILGSESLA